MTPHAGWLVDTSAIRPHEPAFAAVLVPRVSAGLVSICLVTELEVGFAARSTADFARVERDVLDLMNRLVQPVRAEARAREVQRELMDRDHHRAVAVRDLLVAAVAEVEGLTVLHHDGDFDPDRRDHRTAHRMDRATSGRMRRRLICR